MSSIETALSTHTACFTCRENNRSLHQVKKKTLFTHIKLTKSTLNIMQDVATLILMKMG
jgi:hypothetical protein